MRLLDPVAAYGRIAPIYRALAAQRQAYINAVDQLVISQVPANARSLLDIGAGDGSRSRRIAEAAGIARLVLLEPSEEMQTSGWGEAWPMRAEDLCGVSEEFDVITLLWNVLGHIFSASARLETLRQCARLITPKGRIFADVSHRYNVRHYGVLRTGARFLKDRIAASEKTGDVIVDWEIEGEKCATTGHVFTHREMAGMCQVAGLQIANRTVLDYSTGAAHAWSGLGHLVYELRR